MLTFYGSKSHQTIIFDPKAEVSESVDWIDAFQPTEDELLLLAKMMGAPIPTMEDLVEIESSSRLSTNGDVIVMSLPATVRDADDYPKATPIGFVVGKDRVATIRFEHLPSFEKLANGVCAKGELSTGGLGATVSILEIVVDHLADVLEKVGGDLDDMSRRIFTSGLAKGTGKGSAPKRDNRKLAISLYSVGRDSDLISKVNESLAVLGRMGPFLVANTQDVPSDIETRTDMVASDIKSLHEFQEHLVNKTQFLLDTLLGLSNVEQNNVFRVLTIVSVVGIPPTFFASMYGMNFKNIPEYDWSFGYQYGLALIALSAIAPAVWFKVKGWW